MKPIAAIAHGRTRTADAGADVTADAAPTAGAAADEHARTMFAQEQALEEQTQATLLFQRQQFDLTTEARSEFMREQDAVRDLLMAELKDEDAYLKKWIELI